MKNINICLKKEDTRYTGMYRAYVVDDEDPRDIGRVKLRVLGVYSEDVPDTALPWAIPATSLYRSGGDNTNEEMSVNLSPTDLKTAFNKTGTGGNFTVPARGNHVWIWFDNGNHMHPVYFAMAPGEDDWLTQKDFIKEKLTTKIAQIESLRTKFSPIDGTSGVDGTDWGDLAHINARQGLVTEGKPSGKGKKITSGSSQIKGGSYNSAQLNIDDKENMEDTKERIAGTAFTMDIKNLIDKHTKGTKDPYLEGKIDEPKDTGKNINRYVTSITTLGGTSIIIDNREGQENFYLIHKNFMENIDQEGSRKVFIGRNDPEDKTYSEVTKNQRCNDELAVDGDKKIHVLGNFVTYAKGNIFTQCDNNMQIDVNDSCGIRIKKGDFDIVLEGDQSSTNRDKNAERETGKQKQKADLNIDIKQGNMHVHVQKNANIHVNGNANLKIDGIMKTLVGKDYHLHVKGNYYEKIEGNKYVTVNKNVEIKYNSGTSNYVKTYINGNDFLEIKGNKYLKVIKDSLESMNSSDITITKNKILKVGGNISIKTTDIINSCANFDINGSSQVRIKSSNTSINCAQLKIKASSSSFSGDINSGGSGKFRGNVITSTTNLNSYQGHTHMYTDTYLGLGTLPSQSYNAAGSSPSLSSPSDPKSALTPSSPLSASNNGGDAVVDAERQFEV